MEQQLDKEANTIFLKIYDVTDWATNNNRLAANISKSKDNQAIIFCQLLKYNIRNICLRKSYIEATPGSYHERSKLSIS